VLNKPANSTTLERTRTYLSDVLGVDAQARPWEGSRKIPYALQDHFTVYELILFDQPLLLAIDRGKRTPSLAARQLDTLKKAAPFPVVYVTDGLASYERRGLINRKVPFIVPGNQLYLPDLGVDLREHFRSRPPGQIRSFSPATQALFITSLLRRTTQSRWQPAAIGAELGYTAMTVSRALKELTTAGVESLEHVGNARWLHPDRSLAQTWERALPFLRTPVRQTIWAHPWHLLEEARLAGLSGLAHFSTLVEPEYPVHAVDAAQLREATAAGLKQTPEPQDEACQCQIWNYSPRLQRNSKVVDPLSLWLSFKSERDDRIQLALEELKKHFPWSED
jgi:hypothetical protein